MNETPAETVSTPPRRRQAINIDTSFDQWYSDEVADAITPTSSKGGKRKPRQGHHRRVTSPCDENAVTELRMCSLRQQAASQALSIHSLRNFGNNQRKNTFRMDIQDKINLVDALKTKGFKVASSSRGNWMEGPRIVSFTMAMQQCECQVDKLYYSTDQESLYKVTERIKCKKTEG